MNTNSKKAKLSGMKPSHRRAIMHSQLVDLIHHERLQTTPKKVKLLKQSFDRIVNEAKKNNPASRRNVMSALRSEKAVEKLYGQLLPRLQDSNSGYALSARTLPRKGDGADQAIIIVKGYEVKERKSRLSQVLAKREETEKKPSGIRARLGGGPKVIKAADGTKKDSTKDTRRSSM
jgi:large subunit ribosomal protein L17